MLFNRYSRRLIKAAAIAMIALWIMSALGLFGLLIIATYLGWSLTR